LAIIGKRLLFSHILMLQIFPLHKIVVAIYVTNCVFSAVISCQLQQCKRASFL